MIHLVLVNNESTSNSPPKYANRLIVTHHVYKTKMSLDEQDRNFFDYRYLAWVDLINFYDITGSFLFCHKVHMCSLDERNRYMCKFEVTNRSTLYDICVMFNLYEVTCGSRRFWKARLTPVLAFFESS